MPVREPLEDRFFRRFKVGAADECWIWQGAYQRFGRSGAIGYGRIGTGVGSNVEGAHRVSYMLHHGAIPDGAEVLHSCDNPRCVNPNHLSAGTRKQNMDGMVERDRHRDGHRRKGEKMRQREACRHGHSYAATGVRIYVKKNGNPVRCCMECERIWAREAKRRKIAA